VIDDGITPYENFGTGVLIRDNSNNVLVRSNIMRNSYNNVGIAITNSAQSVAVLQNSIYNNQGIGIDLGGNSTHDVNDTNDTDIGPNGMLNSPGYTTITETAGNTDIDFSLDVPAGNYRIEFFSNTTPDSSGIGEGETYLGYTNITHTGSGLEQFTHTLAGTGHNNLALTATEINPSTPSGFGASSEFGGSGQTVQTVSDLVTSTRLLNPLDKSLGNILQYEIKISNLGPNNFNLSNLNNTMIGQNTYFTNILPPQLQYSGIAGPNITCQDYGPGSSSFFGPLLANHPNHSLVSCAHTGNDVLAAGQTVIYTLSATVVDLTTPTFTNHVITSAFTSSAGPFDPDASAIGTIVGGGGDIIDGMSAQYINNYDGASTEVADISLSGTLDNPQDVAPGATLNYTVTLTNNGPIAIDPTVFDGSGINPFQTSLLVAVLPPNLTYVSQSNPDLSCSWAGPGSASLAPFFDNHSTYSLLLCTYVGSDTSLTSGESIATTFRFTTSTPPNTFTTYFLGNGTVQDDGLTDIQRAFTFSSPFDTIELLQIYSPNNFLAAGYTAPTVTAVGINSGSSSGNTATTVLARTGEKIMLGVIVLIIFISLATIYIQRRKPLSH
jgi:hypothetical protein